MRGLVPVAACLALACAGVAHRAVTPARLPQAAPIREAVLQRFGRRVFGAVRAGRPRDLLFDDLALRELLAPAAAQRVVAARSAAPSALGLSAQQRAPFDGARYRGLCLQQGRLEPAGGALGLARPGFVVERLLVVAEHRAGGPVAAWVEGEFVHSSAGFGALSIRRVEAPRRDHSDLELAVCEIEVGRVYHNPW